MYKKVMSKEIPVKYNDEIVGYTTDEGKTIQFNDSDTSKKVKEMLNQKQTAWVSSRAVGEIDSNNNLCYCGDPVDMTDPDCVEYNLCKEHSMDV
jgi:hypothetical protein